MIVDHLHLEAAPLGPAGIHALQHLRPVLAFGATSAGIDFDIGVIGVGLPREQRLDLVGIGTVGEFGEGRNDIVDHRGVAFGFGDFDEAGIVLQLAFDLAGGGHRLIETTAFAHHFLRGLGIIPQRRVLDPGVQLVETAEGAIPVKETSSAGQAPAGCG